MTAQPLAPADLLDAARLPGPLPIPGTANFRAAAPGAPGLRPGVLFRGDAPAHLGDEGRDALVSLGIARLIDLRSDEEAAEAPDDVADTGIAVHRVSIMAGSVRDAMAQLAGGAVPDLRSLYAMMLRDGGSAFGRALTLIAEGGATVVHCTAGKDRTGLAIALALLAVGVDLETVVADYARTEENLAGAWVERMAARVARYGVALDGDLRELVASSPAPALRGAVQEVVLVNGSADAYLDGIGVDADVRARLRAVLRADDAPDAVSAESAPTSAH
ncbi:tyrosine-protein phosphatase [Microbacterium sp. Au-Mic1]|uniref:tyrosine-protein phosphatase n=1 Tax=Microbacterium sp. Au-Mic1 TaxID=2906457 RepID=UPI001E4D06EA|nr:tyrosine-protein phosphatase [Microbacterium sp. Au-Mic1]MCE4026566.1 tyrosine-protein phosphatase [Microbacterium sp. Au-Mic1]